MSTFIKQEFGCIFYLRSMKMLIFNFRFFWKNPYIYLYFVNDTESFFLIFAVPFVSANTLFADSILVPHAPIVLPFLYPDV